MDQRNSSSNEDYEFRPTPYASSYGEQNSYTGMTYQVGTGNVAVVTPSGTYDNIGHPEGPVESNQQHGLAAPPYFYDSEDGSFSSAAIRRGFIRKVYLTLLIQLLCTVGIICAFLYWNTLKIWVLKTYWFSYSMMSVVLVLILVLSCCDNIRRQVPLNFIALGLFTIAEGLMLGSVAVYFQADAVMWAVGATALVSFGMSLFAMQSKWDFTPGAGCMWALGWSLVSFALLCAIFRSQYLYIFYAFLGTVLFSLYLVFDTQLILGGKHRKYEISPEEYVFAALSLYLDIVTLFLFLLQFFNLCR
ncbi:protein lifeguard 1 [Melanotaenia boesemani]|uniref:protein lifeguard 1 n=1 Tax=Melanotaenia boesemani TaxID=1250792 RepID=UPI001C0541E8|nr:protein lifeguard 1 [Melanotaenia boesemani]XP_041842749.1 protein lifeguard 1 [Melanotaenia boesemani]XP_041842750.1 protein lifeguard 1 [Melanotaenia boesemani]